MSPERFEELTSRFLSGEALSPQEDRELAQAIESDPALRERFLKEAILDGRLRGLTQGRQDRGEFTRLLGNCLEAETDGTRFLKKLESRLGDTPRMGIARPEVTKPSKRPTRRWREGQENATFWKAGLAAAGVFVAILAFLTFSSPRPVPKNASKSPSLVAKSEDDQHRKALQARQEAEAQEARRMAEQAASFARAERERMEKELDQQEAERRRVKEALKGTVDTQEQERLKQLEAELAKANEAFKERVRLAQEKERETAQAAKAVAAPQEKPSDPPQGKPPTESAMATIDSVAGEAFVIGKEGRTPAREGMVLQANQGLETARGPARVVLTFGDKTQLEVGPETVLKEIREAGGKRVLVDQGTVRGEIPRQPPAQPMVFAGAVAEATVRGTTLRILVDPDPKKGMRLEVEEGKVELKRLSDQKTVLVESGHYAVAATGVELAAKRLPIGEIYLTAKHAKISGNEWRFAPDSKTSSGHAVEIRATAMKGTFPPAQDYKESNCVTYEFTADADQDYGLWIRARSIAKEINYKTAGTGDDAFVIELPEATLRGEPGTLSPNLHSPQRVFFDGYSIVPGYSWIAGPENSPRGTVLVTARFPRAGRQILRIYGVEPPVRIDAIWLSTTQKTRPEAGVTAPPSAGRR